MILNTDFELDCLLAKILNLQPPERENYNEPYLTTIGYSIPDENDRRLMAIKIVQKFFSDFKSSEAKPVSKIYLLSKEVNPYLIDKYLPILNKYMVENGVTTKKRVENFLGVFLKQTHNLSVPYLTMVVDIEAGLKVFCQDWSRVKGNYLSDIGETGTLYENFGLR